MKEAGTIDSKHRSEWVAETIVRMVENGELREGDKLPSEPELARQLGVSRGILREGLAQLKAQGLISRKPKDGTYILPLDHQDGITDPTLRMLKTASFRNVMEMRDAIEQKAVALAVERATDDELEELREMFLGKVPKTGVDDLDYYFHYRLVELSGNSVFMGIVSTYFEEIREIRDTNLDKPDHKKEVRQEHLAILDALCRRDSAAAVAAISAHMQHIWDRWQETAGR